MKYQTPEDALKDIFGYDNFRDKQKEIIQANLDGRDGLVIMATGGGKSICFQIPAIMREGTTIVISPLVALMKDQVDSLRGRGVSATCFYHDQDDAEKRQYMAEVMNKKAKLVYVSPEKLRNEDFMQMMKLQKIESVIMDEAHCLSTWGHDFRPDYRLVGKQMDILEKAMGYPIQRIGFTATATPETRKDIISTMDLKNDPYIYVGPFDRPNISLEVRNVNNKYESVRDLINQNHNIDGPIIIYAPSINQITGLRNYLMRNGIRASIFHGRLNQQEKKQTQEDFVNGKIKIIIATKAFGAGIDIPNVRIVAHLAMPGNLEDYDQEVGRAGRDGKPSKAVTYYNRNDTSIHHFFIGGNFPSRKIIEGVALALQSLSERYDGDSFSTNLEEIANTTKLSNLTNSEVDSALRFLSENEMINLLDQKSFDQELANVRGIEVIDLLKEIDYENINARKRNAFEKLAAMQGYCETTTCRRTYKLEYMGESHRAGLNCGSCDNCNRNLSATEEFKEEFPSDAVVSALLLIKGGHGKISEINAARLLRGVENRQFSRKGWTEIDGFGHLQTWMTPKIQALVAQLKKSEFIKEDEGKLTITGNGVSWMAKSNNSKPSSIVNEAKKENVRVDLKLRKFIEEQVASMANKYNAVPGVLVGDDVIDFIASEKRPITLEVLSDAGLTRAKIAMIGIELIEAIELYRKTEYKNSQKEMGLSLG